MLEDPHNPVGRLFASRSLRLHYLVIPKCGCTFVKNLIWRIDHGSYYDDQRRIHDLDHLFARSSDFGLTVKELRREPAAFTVLRSPVDRFFSLYMDKVMGSGHQSFVPLRHILQSKYGLNPSAQAPDEHTRNCEIMIDWIGKNLSKGIDLAPDSHWIPQVARINIIRKLNLKLLMLNKLSSQVSLLLNGLEYRDLGLIKNVNQNKSSKEFMKSDILTKCLRSRINEIYAGDKLLHDAVRSAWTELTPKSIDEIPRFESLKPTLRFDLS